jgi:predicted ATPase
MHYKKFTIKNYKGIKDLTIDLEKEPKSKVFTLVGLNESGKTSILEAINLFQNDIAELDNHKLIPKDKKLNFNDAIEIKALIGLDSHDEKILKEFAKTLDFTSLDDFKEIAITRKKLFRNSVYSNEGHKTFWTISIRGYKKGIKSKKTFDKNTFDEWNQFVNYIRDNLLPPIIYYPNFLFDFPSKIYLEKYDDETGEQETYREVVSDILDSIGGGLNINDHVLDRLKSESDDAKEALESTISNMSSKVSQTVFQAWQSIFQSKGKEIVLKAGVEGALQSKKYYLEVRLKEGSNHYQIAERSLGFKWFFTFLLFTEFRKMRSTDKGEILFLLDEPASNLHSTAQKKLLGTFEKLVSKCKLIYTTHSHHLINPNWLSGAYIIRNKNLNYEDEINFESEKTDVEAILYKQFVAKHPNQKTYFQPILDTLDYQPGLLEEVPEIIITEGKNDYYTLKLLNEVYFRNKFSLHLYPGIGSDKNDQIISLYLAWNRKFKILLDGDQGGENAKKRYLNNFGIIVKDYIISLKEIDPKFSCAMEELFTDEEKILITKVFDSNATDYDKSKFNTAIQSLFLLKEKIELSETTIQKFEKLFTCLAYEP